MSCKNCTLCNQPNPCDACNASAPCDEWCDCDDQEEISYCYQDASMNGAGANFHKLHPTQKPVGLMSWCIEKTKPPESGTILDPYMGSGTTGVAALQTGRRFIGVEYVREYFDIACERITEAQAQGRLEI